MTTEIFDLIVVLAGLSAYLTLSLGQRGFERKRKSRAGELITTLVAGLAASGQLLVLAVLVKTLENQ